MYELFLYVNELTHPPPPQKKKHRHCMINMTQNNENAETQ